MSELLYFAYGSNMLRQRLDARCPHIRPAGIATLADYQLTFDLYSPLDDSGKGAIEAAPGQVVHGVLWSLPLAELPALDRAESCGQAYDRVQRQVTHADGRALDVTTYLPLRMRAGLRPWDWYLQLVVAGAEQQRLPADYVAAIRQISVKIDPQQDRPGRLTALDALTRAGLAG